MPSPSATTEPPTKEPQPEQPPSQDPQADASTTSEPLAKRVKPNPGPTTAKTTTASTTASSGGGEHSDEAAVGKKSPPTVLPFDPAHPGASAAASSDGNNMATDRPSLPSMAALMSPDPNSSTLPAPPNTAAFPPGSGAGGAGPGHHHGPPPMGLGFGGPAPLPPVPPLQIKLLVPGAKAPSRGSAFAAGYDLYAAEATSVPKSGGRKLVSTGIACAVPSGTYARIAPRSGLAVKHGIATGAGVVDEDYRGEVKVLLFNHGEEDFAISSGDRIAQMVLERIVTPDVLTVDTLEESVRGAGGFGSTGGFGGAA